MTHRRGRIVAMHVFDAFRTFGLEKDFFATLISNSATLAKFRVDFFPISNFVLTFADTCIKYNSFGIFVKVTFYKTKGWTAHVWAEIS